MREELSVEKFLEISRHGDHGFIRVILDFLDGQEHNPRVEVFAYAADAHQFLGQIFGQVEYSWRLWTNSVLDEAQLPVIAAHHEKAAEAAGSILQSWTIEHPLWLGTEPVLAYRKRGGRTKVISHRNWRLLPHYYSLRSRVSRRLFDLRQQGAPFVHLRTTPKEDQFTCEFSILHRIHGNFGYLIDKAQTAQVQIAPMLSDQ